MKRRFRLTGFARFFFVMLFIVPVAYFGAAYYNGEDGLQNLKNLLGIDKGNTTAETKRNTAPSSNGYKNASDADWQELKRRVENLEKENRDLKVKIRDLDLELKAAKMQLDRARSGGK